MLDLFPGEQILELRQGNIDMALTQDSANLLGRECQTRKLAVIKSIACLPCDHPLSNQNQVKLGDLKNETFLFASDSDILGFRRRLNQLCRTCGKFRPKTAEISTGLSDAFSAVANDGVVAVMPDFLRHQKRPGMVIVPISDPGATWELVIAWQKGQTAEPLRVILASLRAAGGS